MSRNLNSSAEAWDLGVADFIEEIPEIDPMQPTQFRKNVNIYMVRGLPSWETPHNKLARSLRGYPAALY